MTAHPAGFETAGMTPNDSQSNGAAVSADNVISVSFNTDSNAYAALAALKELDAQSRVGVEAAAVIVRGDSGNLSVKDGVGSDRSEGAATGGLLGLLIGILGGPLGVLLGGTYGLMVGSLFDLEQAEDTESVLSQISTSVRPGHTALLAQVTERSPEVIDTAMAGLGGTVLRRPVTDVEGEIALAEQAQREAQRQATTELLRGRRERTKEQIRTKVDELKTKLTRRETAAGA